MFKRVLVGLDGSAGSQKAFGAAVQLVVEQGADLLSVSIEEHLPHYAAMVGEVDEAKRLAGEYFDRVQADARDEAQRAGIQLQTATLAGHAAQRIVEYAKAEKVDLLVLGHSGHTGVWGQFLGTTADKVTRHATCSVLVVR
jgi:nucleotide-binding universal stress UspA family protein